MKAERVVIDTNVLISAALIDPSLPALLLAHCLLNHRILLSDATFEEFETRLWRPKFDRYLTVEDRRKTLGGLSKGSTRTDVPADVALRKFSRDPDDEKFVHVALAGGASVLMSGDRDLLDLRMVDGVEIVTPAQAYSRWLAG